MFSNMYSAGVRTSINTASLLSSPRGSSLGGRVSSRFPFTLSNS